MRYMVHGVVGWIGHGKMSGHRRAAICHGRIHCATASSDGVGDG
jgi:hypothetical protein